MDIPYRHKMLAPTATSSTRDDLAELRRATEALERYRRAPAYSAERRKADSQATMDDRESGFTNQPRRGPDTSSRKPAGRRPQADGMALVEQIAGLFREYQASDDMESQQELLAAMLAMCEELGGQVADGVSTVRQEEFKALALWASKLYARHLVRMHESPDERRERQQREARLGVW